MASTKRSTGSRTTSNKVADFGRNGWPARPEYTREALEPEFEIMREMLKSQKEAGLTQAQVVERMGRNHMR